MGMQRMFNVTCDGPDCLNIHDESEWYAIDAVRLARESGWKVSGALAICPECQDNGATFKELRTAKKAQLNAVYGKFTDAKLDENYAEHVRQITHLTT